MLTPPQPENEAQRLAALQDCCLLDSPPDAAFDGLTQLAAQLCETPICAVSLIDEDRQWFKSIRGLDATQTPRRIAFCAHTILQPDLLIVPDTREDARFTDNPLVTGEPHIRFYAGAPLINADGLALGSLCVIDTKPRRLTPAQKTGLRLLADQVIAQIELVKRIAAQERLIVERAEAQSALERERQFQTVLLENLGAGVLACDAQGTPTLFNRAAREFHGLPEPLPPPGRWAEYFDLYQADGLTPMRPEDIPRFRALRGEIVHELEMVIAPRNGPARTVLASGQAIFGAHGAKIGAVVAMHDVTERRWAERETARLAAIVESSEEAILTATLDGTLVFWNAGAERLYGYSASEMVGRHASVLAAPGQAGPVPEVITRLQRGEKVEPIEVSRRRRDGTWIEVSLSFSPIKDGLGEMIGLSCISCDITARVAAERALRESEAALRAVLESAPIILYAADTAGTVTLSEGTGLTTLGLTPGEAVGRSVFEFSGGDAGIEANTRRALAGESVSWDARVGNLCLHTELRPVRDAAGAVTGLIGVCFDVTERALADERFRVLFEQSSDAHLLCGADGIIDCNNATLGMMRCEDKGQLLHIHPALLSPEFQPEGGRSAERGLEMEDLAREHGSHHFEWIHRRLDGEEFPTEVWLTPVTLATGTAMLAVLHDLTERKRAEEQIKDHAVVLEFQKIELERANAELEALATTDGMTGLKNRRAFGERLAEEVSRADRYQTPLSVVLLDVDHFKQYNDAYGHPEGDTVLKTVGRLLQANARETDVVARYGGEEFVLLLPQTDGAGAQIIAERVRLAIESFPWPQRAVTASLGVATLGIGTDDGAALVNCADQALYHAKAGGRNRVAGARVRSGVASG